MSNLNNVFNAILVTSPIWVILLLSLCVVLKAVFKKDITDKESVPLRSPYGSNNNWNQLPEEGVNNLHITEPNIRYSEKTVRQAKVEPNQYGRWKVIFDDGKTAVRMGNKLSCMGKSTSGCKVKSIREIK